MGKDLADTLTDYSNTAKGAIRGFVAPYAAAGEAVGKAIGIEPSSPGLPSNGYNKDGTPPAYPVYKVDDSIKKKEF